MGWGSTTRTLFFGKEAQSVYALKVETANENYNDKEYDKRTNNQLKKMLQEV